MSENGLRHNFIDPEILDAGGFSVSLKILQINSDSSDTANRYAGFAVGLNESEASGGNDIATASPKPFRGNGSNLGVADCFLELDLNGNVKWWSGGVLQATVPVGATSGTLTASFKCSSFAAGSSVTMNAYLDGNLLDLDPTGPGTAATFSWNESNANYLGLSARASSQVLLDNVAVRLLPVSQALAVNYALARGLESADGDLAANPDGDRLNNFGEWAFGTDPDLPDDELASTSLILEDGILRFAHRRLEGMSNDGSIYHYLVSDDLQNWQEVTAVEESASSLSSSPGYEVVTLSLPESATSGRGKLFLRVIATTP